MISIVFCCKCGSILQSMGPELERCPACHTQYRLRLAHNGDERDAWVEVRNSEGVRL